MQIKGNVFVVGRGENLTEARNWMIARHGVYLDHSQLVFIKYWMLLRQKLMDECRQRWDGRSGRRCGATGT